MFKKREQKIDTGQTKNKQDKRSSCLFFVSPVLIFYMLSFKRKDSVRPVPLPGKCARQPFFYFVLLLPRACVRHRFVVHEEHRRKNTWNELGRGGSEAGQARGQHLVARQAGQQGDNFILATKRQTPELNHHRGWGDLYFPPHRFSSSCPACLRSLHRWANRYNRWALVRVWCAQQ